MPAKENLDPNRLYTKDEAQSESAKLMNAFLDLLNKFYEDEKIFILSHTRNTSINYPH